MALAFALFFAVTAAAQNLASLKITQQVEGKLEQDVYAGEDIELVKIVYENTGFGQYDVPEYSSTDFYENFGLSKTWTKGPACVISGRMRSDIVADTYSAFIVVKDNEGKLAKTELIFHVKERLFSLEWREGSGSMNQTVNAGDAIDSIVFNYEGITSYGVSKLPSGLESNVDVENHKIIIYGTVNKDIISDDYEYKVFVKNDQGKEISKSGKISVTGGEAVTSIQVEENEKQKVVAGDEIKPVVFQFKNVRIDEKLSAFKTDEGSLKGVFNYSVQDGKLTVSGTVDENLQDGTYYIKIVAVGENNEATASASVEVSHKPVVTKITVIKNESQKVTAGDSIKPIVFYKEHALELVLPNFPGGYRPITSGTSGDTVTIIGLIQEGSKGLHDIVLSVIGPENQATAKATIEVIPATMTFDLVEGSDNQTVVAGQDITPIVYQYSHMYSVKGTLPANLKVEQDKGKKQVKIYGTIDPESATHEYAYTFDLTDFYGNTKTVSGKVNVVASIEDQSSSSSAKSSSSSAKSSSSVSSSSCSSSAKSSSSSAKSSSSSAESSSSSAKSSSSGKVSSSSAASYSSCSTAKSSSSVKSSSSTKSKSSSSSGSVKSSSSSAKSSGKSSSSKVKSSSSEKSDSFSVMLANNLKLAYANNELTVSLPNSSMVRVQVFDLMGHQVESFAESVNRSRTFSLAHLNKGKYVARIDNGRSVRMMKIIVK